ncbi:MAG: hypothetical protein JXR52_08655 [Bacteroidales bacterium]|nr:hypothetical protein [Bacteroidales bacterium]MBN2698882.1 hypothetical protein [Bacteroidales bacterium]
MEEITFKITTLTEDIEQILENVPGRKPDIMRFCRDHRDPYRHHDTLPVLNMTQDEMLGIYDMNAQHFFLRPDHIARFAGYLKLRLPNTLALMLKAEWEYLLSRSCGYFPGRGLKLESILTDPALAEKLAPDFKPNISLIYKAVREMTDDPEGNTPYGKVELIVRELIRKKVYRADHQLVDRIFSTTDISESTMLFNSGDIQKKQYFRLKELWILKSNELTKSLSLLERTKQQNLNNEENYLRTFGKEFYEKTELILQKEKYSLILELMDPHPDLSLRQLIIIADEKLGEHKREQAELRQKIWRSSNYINEYCRGISGSGYSHDYRLEYQEKCEKLITKLFFLLHSDHCPNYSNLSDETRNKVSDLWMEFMEAKSREKLFSYSPAMLLYNLPDYDELLSIYHQACKILGIDPDDYEIGNRLEFMISLGKPIEEIIEFLQSEIKLLEYHMANIELIQDEYTNEEACRTFREALRAGDAHAETLDSEIAELKAAISELRKRISNTYNIRKYEKTG